MVATMTEGIPWREAESRCARRAPQFPYIPSAEQSREPPRVQTMPECRFNKSNATSKLERNCNIVSIFGSRGC